MLVLGIETATPQLSVALVRDAEVIGELNLALGLKHCERLIIGVDSLLGELGLETGDLEGVAVSIGPGSFTGLRIGVAAAQGLATALGVPIAAVPTLLALGAGAMAWQGPLVACLDARRGEVYFCACQAGAAGIERRSTEQVAAPARVPGLVPFAAGERLLIVGDLAQAVATEFTRAGHDAVWVPGIAAYPRAAQVATLGAAALAEGRGLTPDAVEPLYLRRSDAELSRRTTTLTGSS